MEADWALMFPEVLIQIFERVSFPTIRKSHLVCRGWHACLRHHSVTVPCDTRFLDPREWLKLSSRYVNLREISLPRSPAVTLDEWNTLAEKFRGRDLVVLVNHTRLDVYGKTYEKLVHLSVANPDLPPVRLIEPKSVRFECTTYTSIPIAAMLALPVRCDDVRYLIQRAPNDYKLHSLFPIPGLTCTAGTNGDIGHCPKALVLSHKQGPTETDQQIPDYQYPLYVERACAFVFGDESYMTNLRVLVIDCDLFTIEAMLFLLQSPSAHKKMEVLKLGSSGDAVGEMSWTNRVWPNMAAVLDTDIGRTNFESLREFSISYLFAPQNLPMLPLDGILKRMPFLKSLNVIHVAFVDILLHGFHRILASSTAKSLEHLAISAILRSSSTAILHGNEHCAWHHFAQCLAEKFPLLKSLAVSPLLWLKGQVNTDLKEHHGSLSATLSELITNLTELESLRVSWFISYTMWPISRYYLNGGEAEKMFRETLNSAISDASACKPHDKRVHLTSVLSLVHYDGSLMVPVKSITHTHLQAIDFETYMDLPQHITPDYYGSADSRKKNGVYPLAWRQDNV